MKRNSINLHSQHGWISALEWFFSNVEQGIVLEDDTIPNHSFFKFCDMMLARYKEERSAYFINGADVRNNPEDKFIFTQFASGWGWASWRDRFSQLDVSMSEKIKAPYRNRYFQRVFKNGLDYSFQYMVWKNEGYCIQPSKNLITNIGLDKHAVHTKGFSQRLYTFFDLPTYEIDFEKLEFDPRNYDKELLKIKYPNKLQKLQNLIRSSQCSLT